MTDKNKKFISEDVKHMLEVAQKYMAYSNWKEKYEIVIEKDNKEEENVKRA